MNLKFDAGVTAIVGPNGCGKTNIVDAIRWALGEQRYSTLRSDKMEDVIFNGTKNRKPLGLSEVSLTIQNTKGILPTEYSEVTITRRVYRSGESEYLLNKAPCRLKDILDLFMDTGMGADAYSVIELKMIETILSDKTDERRKLFEEAAGVTKYKFRRKAAFRKLDEVQKDLMRVNDIVKEVQKTVNSLERQAKKAEQHTEVTSRLKALEIDLLEREYAFLHSKLVPLEERHRNATTDKEKIDALLHERESRLDDIREELRVIEGQLIEAQRALAGHRETLHKHEEKILIANERRNALKANIARYEQEKIALQEEANRLETEYRVLEEKRLLLADQITALDTELAGAKTAAEIATREFEAKKNEVQALNESLLQLAHQVVEKRGDRERLKGRIDNTQGRIDRSREEIELYRTDIEDCTQRVAALTEKDRELRKRFLQQEMSLVEQENRQKSLKAEMEELERAVVERRHEIDQRTQQIEFIRGLIESNESFTEGAKYLLGSPMGKQKSFLTVADAVQTADEYRLAIEAALGDSAVYIIVERQADIAAAIEELKNREKGKATFVCLERIPRLTRKTSGSLQWAKDVVKCKPQYRRLFDFLLDGVVLAASVTEADVLMGNVVGLTCVTPEGQIVNSRGIARGGSHTQYEGGRIGNQAHIDQLQGDVERLGGERDTLSSRLEEVKSLHDAIALETLRQDVKAIEKNMTAVEMQIAQVEFEKKRAHDAIERNQLEQTGMEQEHLDLSAEYDSRGIELTRLEQDKAEHDSGLTVSQTQLETLEVRFNETTAAVKEFEMTSMRLNSDHRNVTGDLERNRKSSNDTASTIQRREDEIRRAGEEIIQLGDALIGLENDLALLQQAVDEHTARQQEIDKLYSTKRNDLHDLELKLKDERRLHDESVATAHDLAMKITELRSNSDHLRERAKEEFELDLALKTYPEDEWIDFAQLREEVKNLKDRIRVLGAINFAAFDEFKTESERLAFLTQQRDDLLEAEKSLMEAIEEINTTAQKKFLDTFGLIRTNFIRIFKELFLEGDICDLKLQEDADPLEASIEIFAQPRGKRPTSIDLLSGGEKTLTAIALLFAIYLVKPSPFCILDEVDAPLDDSNIDRYTRILKKFSDNTQFIVVTHNKRTMEAAHALYGVTMEEEGVSKLVTVRFNEEARVRSATLSSGI